MAKDTLNTKELDQAAIDRLKLKSRTGSDADLADPDKRTRARILPTAALAENDRVRVSSGQTVVVLGPGRGKDTFVAAWVENIGGTDAECIGTFFEHQIER